MRLGIFDLARLSLAGALRPLTPPATLTSPPPLGTKLRRIAALAVLGLYAAAAHAQTTIEPANAPPPRQSAVPVPAGQIERAIAGLDDLARDVLERSGIPGLAVAVVHEGRTVYARGFGVRRVGQPEQVDADTAFLLASVSKPVGATVVASEVTAGRVSWDTPVVELLPWFALSEDWVTRHVTIGDLYAHRSGLPDHAGDDLEDIGYDRRAVLERLSLLPLHPFRNHYAYTNFGLTAAAEAVARAAGADWATLSQRALYDPLGMDRTSSRHADYVARANRASSHIPSEDGYAVADLRQPDAQSPAGGVSSTVNDMARWMALVLGGGRIDGQEIFAEDALLPAVTAQSISGPSATMDARPTHYGYGFVVGTHPSGRVVLSHSGGFSLGASTYAGLIPSLDIGIVVLTNASPVGAAEAIGNAFLERVELGTQTRDWFAAYGQITAPLMSPVGKFAGLAPPAEPEPFRDLSAYAGVYENAYFGEATVTVTGDGLSLTVGPLAEPVALDHWSGDVFTYAPFNENAPAGSVSQVSFTEFDGVGAGEVFIERLDEAGFGTFARAP